jgi:hypothetical protein
MIDEENDSGRNFYFTEEYLGSRFPEQKSEIISLLKKFNLKSDCDIVFNEQVHHIFRDMVASQIPNKNLNYILKQQKIVGLKPDEVENFLEDFQKNRDTSIKEMVTILLKLTKLWSNYHEIESKVDDFIELDEKEVLRPEEEKEFQTLDQDASIFLDKITFLTKNYLEILIDFLFKFGGDIQLQTSVTQFDELKTSVDNYYNELFLRSGLKSDESE